MLCILEYREHAGQDLEAEIIRITQPVSATLEDADFVVEAFDETERDLVFRFAVGGDPIPVSVDANLIGFEPLQDSRASVQRIGAPSLHVRVDRRIL